jgi:hypothetical protein
LKFADNCSFARRSPGFLTTTTQEVCMYAFIPRSLCALKRVAARHEHGRFGATQGIRIAVKKGLYRAEATDGRRVIYAQGVVDDDLPWPGYRDTPDDAFETVVPTKDLERACKTAETALGKYSDAAAMVGLATTGTKISLGLGNDVMATQAVDGRFPNIANVVPTTRPMFTFRIDPKLFAETLLAMSALLPETAQGVQVFFYGKDTPIGLCARNPDNGMMIDALVVPLMDAAKAVKAEAAAAKAQTKEPTPAEPGKEPGIPQLVQYREAKQRHPSMVLLFRNGDFYELFSDDAELAAKVLGLTLSTLGDTTVPMCGFRQHELETYLQKLVSAGHRVAVAEPVPEVDPKPKPNGKSKKSK